METEWYPEKCLLHIDGSVTSAYRSSFITEVKNSGGQEGHTGTERARHLCKPGKTWQGSTYEANTGSKRQGSWG